MNRAPVVWLIVAAIIIAGVGVTLAAVYPDYKRKRDLQAAGFSTLAEREAANADGASTKTEHDAILSARELAAELERIRLAEQERIRQAGVERERAAAIERARVEEAARRRAAERYTALVACRVGREIILLQSCLGDSELRVTRGNRSQVFRAWDLHEAGRIRNDGVLVIDLPREFVVRAQNSGRHLTLEIRIADQNNRIVFSDQAGEWGVVSVRN